ncbi:unnamed protein product [Ilex paraguariensis]|uniref:Mechanosensitive ion channel MscS domain-containing protein n=1 Tax=Ilex paraguariensis TaxID=185542 RepID=A0ABC8T715_9AQUA
MTLILSILPLTFYTTSNSFKDGLPICGQSCVGLGTVLLTLAGREIFTNFLSSAMIHATRPFVVNEWIQTKIEGYEISGTVKWIQTKIEGYEISGTVKHVGWWSPTIVRGEDCKAVHIPNHKFAVNMLGGQIYDGGFRKEMATLSGKSPRPYNKVEKIASQFGHIVVEVDQT